MPTFEEWVASQGFDPAGLSEQQLAALKITFATLYPDTGGEGGEPVAAEGETPEEAPPAEEVAAEGETPPEEEMPTNAGAKPVKVKAKKKSRPDPVADENRRIAANRRRVSEIDRICGEAGNPSITVGGRSVSLAAHAVEQNWTAERTELHALRAARGAGPNVVIRSHDRDCTRQALEGALILRAGGRLDHPAYARPAAGLAGIPAWLRAGINDAARNRVMDNAHRYADLSAVDLCREALRLDGREVPAGRSEMIRAAFSGGSLTNVFTTNVNAILLATYAEAADSTVGWVQERDVADFRTQERPRMLKGPNLTKLPRGGAADHVNRSDGGETYKIARYAQQFEVDEQDIIDDMLGALADMPVEMGMAAARLRPDLVYAILLDNPSLTTTGRDLFNTTDGNLNTSSALTAATLKVAVKDMLLFQENGVNLNLMPTHLVVPPALRHTARELTQSDTIVVAGTAGSVTERGSMNTIKMDSLTPVSDARLENGLTHPDLGTALSGSATTWYLVSALAHTIEVGYLRGTGRSPRVRSWKLDREGRYGQGWDVSFDIGAKAMDWKGFVQNTA